MSKYIVSAVYVGLLSSTVLTPTLSNAADGDEDALSEASIVTYEADFFIQYDPVSLLDMLQRIPGISDVLNSGRRGQGRGQRGFGNSGDQILIDGKRLAGKSNNINDTLSRIPSTQVVKIDLIRGASSGLDVQSDGLVINIILAEGASQSTTFVRVIGEYTFGHKFLPQFLVSHNGPKGNLNYTFNVERKNDNNGLFEPNQFFFHEERVELGDDPDSLIWDRDTDNGRWEVGGDYSRNLGFLGRSKTLFVVNRGTEDTEVFRQRDLTDPQYTYREEFTDAVRSEKIFRTSITPTIAAGQTIEIGGEVAINTFDKVFNSFDRDEAPDPLQLKSADNVEIQENRYEVFAIHSYNITPKFVMQSSLTTEFSNIIADNIFADNTVDRRDTSLTYLKPRVNFRYDYTERDQMRLTVEKKVSQLRFDSFVTSYDAQNDEVRVGNTELLPTQTWEFVLGYEHRLANDAGTFEGQAYYHHRIDHQTRIDFTEYRDDIGGNIITVDEFFNLPPSAALRDETDFVPTQGNIDSAYIYGVDLKSNLRLGFIGVPDAVLSLGYRFEKRRSLDQFTQLMRNFARHSDHVYNINYRHDITSIGLAYGFIFNIRSDWANYDMRYFQPQSPSARISAFAEYNLSQTIKMRLDLIEITGSQGHQTTIRYTDHIRFNEINAREERENNKPRALQVSLQGSF